MYKEQLCLFQFNVTIIIAASLYETSNLYHTIRSTVIYSNCCPVLKSDGIAPKTNPWVAFFVFLCCILMCSVCSTCEARSHVWISSIALSGSVSLHVPLCQPVMSHPYTSWTMHTNHTHMISVISIFMNQSVNSAAQLHCSALKLRAGRAAHLLHSGCLGPSVHYEDSPAVIIRRHGATSFPMVYKWMWVLCNDKPGTTLYYCI